MKLKDIKGLSKELIHTVCAYKKQFVFDKCKNHEQCKDIAQAIGEKEFEVDVEKVGEFLENKYVAIDRTMQQELGGYIKKLSRKKLAQAIAKADIFKVKEVK